MRNMLVAAAVILLGVTVVAGYYSLQKTAWIFGDPYVNAEYLDPIKITPEELQRFPTVKEYVEYLPTAGRTPAGSRSIDFWEAKSFVDFLKQKTIELKPWKLEGYEVYSTPLEILGKNYGINIAFGERPILD
jgi:hypothetical protein